DWLSRLMKPTSLGAIALSVILLTQGLSVQPAHASLNRFCQISQAEADRKESLRAAGLQGDATAQRQYTALSQQHARDMRNCRRTQWPANQAVWLRLYPCDLQPGRLDAVMDRIVNLGYNQVYIEAFANGQVLLPKNDNPTVWPSLVQWDEYADRDLLAEAIDAARDRNLKAYAWMFTINFGYSYGQRTDRRQVLARNGSGADTLDYANNGTSGTSEESFIDPYNPQAQRDYALMVREVLERRPDGALYDYVRYPRLLGGASVASEVKDLWIYGPSARQALLNRSNNKKGRELIQRFLQRGYLTEGDVAQADRLFPDEGEPLWQSRNPPAVDPDDLAPAAERRPGLQNELWRLSVAHAIQGIVDFLQAGASPARSAGIPAGAVFFPYGNRAVGNGYDARLQHWNRFPSWMEFHPMSYATCGNASCIVDEVRRVLSVRNASTVKPALAGLWGTAQSNRPSLEAQMDALQRATPQINTVSHFALNWLDPEFDRMRKTCAPITQRTNRDRLLSGVR
ncbi:MAG: family 10 glycosylhydrolase, partial [Cyanobacteria bacterium J06632_3]